MRRIACSLACLLTGLLVGCQNAKPQAAPRQLTGVDYDSLQPDLYATDAGTSYTATDPVDSAYPALQAAPAPSINPVATTPRTHRVVKGDTLYQLARKYYGDQSRWKEIYEANRSRLSTPNMLRVGLELSLP